MHGGGDFPTKQRARWHGDVEEGLTLARQGGCLFTEALPGGIKIAPGKSLQLVLGIDIQMQQKL